MLIAIDDWLSTMAMLTNQMHCNQSTALYIGIEFLKISIGKCAERCIFIEQLFRVSSCNGF